MSNRAKGTFAETQAVNFLQRSGFEIIARNYTPKANFHGGEIDIIAKRNNMIHFIEVKSRNSDAFGCGREAVTLPKQKTIRRLATRYLVENGIYHTAACCFSVVEISGQKIEIFENCF